MFFFVRRQNQNLLNSKLKIAQSLLLKKIVILILIVNLNKFFSVGNNFLKKVLEIG